MSLKNPHYRFGEKLRAVRERKNITLKDVAALVHVSESLLSQIERNKVSPSIDTLMAIVDALEIDFEYLFKDYKKNKKVTIVRSQDRTNFIMQNVTYQQLTDNTIEDEHAVEALMLEISPGGEKGNLEYGHLGRELGIILEGCGELIYGTESYIICKGDSISFPADIPHILKNTSKQPMKALWVICPPRLFPNT